MRDFRALREEKRQPEEKAPTKGRNTCNSAAGSPNRYQNKAKTLLKNDGTDMFNKKHNSLLKDEQRLDKGKIMFKETEGGMEEGGPSKSGCNEVTDSSDEDILALEQSTPQKKEGLE